MVNDEFRAMARQTVLPVILDHNGAAHRLAASLFRRYGIASMVCGDKQSLRDRLSLCSAFLLLFHEKHPALAAEQLMDFARTYEELILILIPITEEQQRFVADHRALLEDRYLLSDPKAVFTCAPLANF